METFSDLSSLISTCYAHQSEEEANSIRVPRARTGNSGNQHDEGDPLHDSEQEGNQVHPHRLPADASHHSHRRHLAKEINAIIKSSTPAPTGGSTGLNRCSRWKGDKPADGPTLPTGGGVTVAGNTANAWVAAEKTAQIVSD